MWVQMINCAIEKCVVMIVKRYEIDFSDVCAFKANGKSKVKTKLE